MKRWIFLVLFLIFTFGSFHFVFSQQNLEVYFFYSATCPHCAQEKKFLEEFEKKHPEIEVKKLGLFERENVKLLKEFYQNYKVPSQIQGFVPITFIGEKYFLGFNEKIARDIESYVLKLVKEAPPEEQPPEEQPGRKN